MAVQIADCSAAKLSEIVERAAILHRAVVAHGKFLNPAARILHDYDWMLIFDYFEAHRPSRSSLHAEHPLTTRRLTARLHG